MTTVRRALAVVLATVLLAAAIGGGLTGAPPAGAGAPTPERRPVIFVHGFVGSGNQFSSQAMRFTSNGYEPDEIRAHEYDSVFATETSAQSFARLDALIAELQVETGAAQVDLLGHSLGTSQMQSYLNSDPARAADVAHYVNLDGATASSPPGGVPTLAVWGAGSPTREITGGTNVYFPEQTHTQVMTSSETFVAVYQFFNGSAPVSPDVVRQPAGEVTIAGRALEFISNVGVTDATLELFEIDGATGARVDAIPEATFALSGDGAFGPHPVDPALSYELVISRTGSDSRHHFYFEPFRHTDHLLRLLTSESGAGIDALWEKSDNHANVVVLRNKEWWGDQGANNDALVINGSNVVNAAIAPIAKRAIAMLIFDAGLDSMSDLSAPVPALAALPFITGIDHFMPAAAPPTGTISLVETPRGGTGPITVNIPNWPGSTDRVTVQFNDYHLTRPLVPDAPENVTATGGPLQATVDWATPPDDGGAEILGYRVLDDQDAVVAETSPAVTEADVIGLAAGALPTFEVVAVNAEGESDPSTPTTPVSIAAATTTFPDVASTHPFFAEITWAAEGGLAHGFDDGRFGPSLTLTRQEVAAFLHRLAGTPGGPFADPGYSDVPTTHPFFNQIAWMTAVGLADGFGDDTFRPATSVSRQEVAAFLHRAAGTPSGPFADPGHTDVATTHPFFNEIAWMTAVGITKSFGDGTFRPATRVSRQEMMAFLYRYSLVALPPGS
jgi:pimeloyl-ACP methyl ester carboxylesterase